MAAQAAALGRSHYPSISSYQTPQSNSPASMNSPQPDSHARSMYSVPSLQSMPAMQQPQSMYYGSQYMQPSVYGQPHASPHPPSQSQQHHLPQHQQQQQHHTPQQQHARHHPQQQLSPAPAMLMSQPVQPAHHQLHQTQASHHPPHQAQHSPTSAYDTKSTLHSQQQTPNTAQSHTPLSSTSNPNPSAQSAAPGPIPATTPLVVRQDNNGVQWIAFEYSRDRVKMEYTIRCDVESVNVDDLSTEFKNANCVYPRACCSKEQYKGNRLHYESDCNSVGWALAQLNPPLREKRGLIQRAVDSWRNSNQDQRLRSRRVRRIAKMNTRKQNGANPSAAAAAAAAAAANSGLAHTPQHHVSAAVGSAHGGTPTPLSSHNDYNHTPAHHHQAPHSALPPTQHAPRYAQNFYPTHPAPLNVHHSLDSNTGMRPASTLATSTAADDEDEEERQQNLFGNIPDSRKRKFILVDDPQRGTRVRVRVTLDKVKLDDMPDAHLRLNAVYPRSYFPRQTSEPRPQWDDEDDSAHANAGRAGGRGSSGPRARDGAPKSSSTDDELPAALGSTFVSCPMLDGSDTQLSLPRMSTSRRQREIALNELGCRMAWGQARQFNGRALFLQRSLDAYRSKTRGSLLAAGNDQADIASHFETRSGKSKFNAARSRYARGT